MTAEQRPEKRPDGYRLRFFTDLGERSVTP